VASFPLIAIFLIGSVITIWDFKFHQIPNESILFLTISLLLFRGGEIFWVSGSVVAIASIALAFFTGLGGGDVKLLMAIGFSGIQSSHISEFLLCLSLFSLPISLLYVARKRTLITQIPLGPAICGALIFTII
jgi:Flp pilus assembly protein protease CpaA